MKEECSVIRIHLKTGGNEGAVDREELIHFCLHNSGFQYVVIGWSCVHEDSEFAIKSFEDYYKAVEEWNQKKREKNGGVYRMNAAINRFAETKENDLFWTRDLEGNYWICRAKGKAEAYYNKLLDIGACVPVEAYKYGIEVPGQISSSFSRAHGGIAEIFRENSVVAFSQQMFNKLSGRLVYNICKIGVGDILDNLPPLDLEELVISYIQIVEGYYVLSKSIAKNSTTIKIECVFHSRDVNKPGRAVVQVKGRGCNEGIDAEKYKVYDDDGYKVYFFAPSVLNIEKLNNAIWITREELLNFYKEYKVILPDSITKWESLFE